MGKPRDSQHAGRFIRARRQDGAVLWVAPDRGLGIGEASAPHRCLKRVHRQGRRRLGHPRSDDGIQGRGRLPGLEFPFVPTGNEAGHLRGSRTAHNTAAAPLGDAR